MTSFSGKFGSNSAYTYEQLFPLLRSTLEAGVAVFLQGSPGIGKSTLGKELALSMKKTLIDIRLAQKDPAEIGGVYFPNRETGLLDLFPPAWVKLACEKPCLIFLDEFNAAITKLHQAAAYQIVLEKRIGEFQFHKDTVILAAGNREDDNAIVTPLSSALNNRFAHYEMRVDTKVWLKWAVKNNIQENIMAFIQAYGDEVLFAATNSNSFATPRSWEMASKIIHKVEQEDMKKAMAACIGPVMADRFQKFLTIYRKIDAAKIIAGKEKIDFLKKTEPSFVYAAIFAVAAYLSNNKIPAKQLENIVSFITSPGINPEFQILFLRQLRNRAPKLFDRLKRLESFRLLADEIVKLRSSLYLS